MDDRTVFPGLLISVRNLSEADSIACLGIEVLDLKEPSDGPLAPVRPELWGQVTACYAGKLTLSAALGEFEQAIDIAAKLPNSFSFAKAGPSNCASLDNLNANWTTLREHLDREVRLVAVAYADHRAADCPSPMEIFKLAGQVGLKTWLLDTFVKDGRSTLDHVTMLELSDLAELAKANRARWVLAGSMRLNTVKNFFRSGVKPSLFGVRGDVCDVTREGDISPHKVQQWLTMLTNESRTQTLRERLASGID